MRTRDGFALATVITVLVCGTASAQYPQSYGSYYQKQVRQPGRVGPNTNVNSYLYDKYFYHKPAVSPYQNLGRRSSSGSSYYQYVRPEQERRAEFQQAGRQYVQQRKVQGNVGHTDYDLAMKLRYGNPNVNTIPRAPSTMPYYSQYGGR